MQLSRYVKQYPCRNNPHQVLLFSTRRLSKAIVPLTLLRALAEGTLAAEHTATLSRLGFLVPDPVAERQEMLTVLDKAARRTRHAFLMVVMNLDCNLACVYCYEGAQRGRHYLSAATADLLVRYCTEQYFARGKDLTIEFYGGEPLLSLARIRSISSRLLACAELAGRSYDFTLVTNGTLLTVDVVCQLVPLGLQRARIALDGPRENHDRYRPFVSGQGSYDKIVANLRAIAGRIGIGLAGNYTKDNYRNFPQLLDELIARGVMPEQIENVIFAPVSDALGRHLVPDFAEGCCSLSEPWLIEAGRYLREEILRRGFRAPKVSASTCMVEFADNLVVHHDGSFYKCPALIGHEGLAVGHLATGVHDYRASHCLGHWQCADCLDCPYLPLCFGGCRFLKLLQQGPIGEVECRRPWFDAVLEEFVLQDIRFP
jgi:uncharacterized protein